ncbi:PaaI family thioesterase [Flectobacillus sp. DC10W]|jgi:uncharacterized protein (TIGR00369 family)|uniref:PaaI family thioesterase n=1 Tax=Flectobacillus longus TaxID=2984207 RepID=A0ABT6YTD6_9BACT|nr:PaaI family thioesterase [Flectobacillus longus]MDI9866694.1 PaaI family thioesterase [Flectobacillus longus]
MSNKHALEVFKEYIGTRVAEKSISPVAKLLDGVLVGVHDHGIEIEYQVKEEMVNPARILHGGIAATMLDDIIGMTVFIMGNGVFYSTVNLSVDYLFSARLGETVRVKSKIVRMGKKIAHAEGEIRNQDDILIAKCTTNLVATSNTIK